MQWLSSQHLRTESKLDFMPGTFKMCLRWNICLDAWSWELPMWVTVRVLPFPTKTRKPPLYLEGCWRLGRSCVKWSVVPVFDNQ